MTTLLIWKILAAIAATPSAAIVARAISRRLSAVWKAKVDETDYLRAEVKREREEAAQAIRDLQAEHAEEVAEHVAHAERLHRRVETLENMRDSLAAELKVAQFDVETARRFVDRATSATSAATTRKDKR